MKNQTNTEREKGKFCDNVNSQNHSKAKIIVERSFGELDLVELYTDYIAEKMCSKKSDDNCIA